jgi:hypothetical protein
LHEHEYREGLGVNDFAPLNQAENLRPRQPVDLDEFVRLPALGSGCEAGGEEEVDALVGEARCGVDRRQPLEPVRRDAGLFLQLAPSAGFRALARIESAGRNLPDVAVGRVPELLNQEHRRVGGSRLIGEGHNGGRARMANHLELTDGAIGEADLVEIQIQNAAGVNAAG